MSTWSAATLGLGSVDDELLFVFVDRDGIERACSEGEAFREVGGDGRGRAKREENEGEVFHVDVERKRRAKKTTTPKIGTPNQSQPSLRGAGGWSRKFDGRNCRLERRSRVTGNSPGRVMTRRSRFSAMGGERHQQLLTRILDRRGNQGGNLQATLPQ